MSVTSLLPKLDELTFLKEKALKKFNEQYGFNFSTDDFCIRSIEPRIFFSLGYELLSSSDVPDNFKLRMYLSFDDVDVLYDYKVETIINVNGVDTTEDEVYVALGTIDKEWLTQGFYKFDWQAGDCGIKFIILTTENGIPIKQENGAVAIAEIQP